MSKTTNKAQVAKVAEKTVKFDLNQFKQTTNNIIATLNELQPDKWYAYLNQTIKCRITTITTDNVFITADNKALDEAHLTSESIIRKAFSNYVIQLKIVEGQDFTNDKDGNIAIKKPITRWTPEDGYTEFKGAVYHTVKAIVAATNKDIEHIVGQEILITPELYVHDNGNRYINYIIERAE